MNQELYDEMQELTEMRIAIDALRNQCDMSNNFCVPYCNVAMYLREDFVSETVSLEQQKINDKLYLRHMECVGALNSIHTYLRDLHGSHVGLTNSTVQIIALAEKLMNRQINRLIKAQDEEYRRVISHQKQQEAELMSSVI